MDIKIGSSLSKRDINSILFLHGESSLKSSGYLNLITENLKKNNIKFLEYSDISPTYNIENIKEIKNIIKDKQFNAILAIGGGTVIDIAKYCAGNLPLFTVPTMASSGSSANNISIINGEIKQNNQPEEIFIIPELTYSVPSNYTTYSVVSIASRVIIENINHSKAIFNSTIDNLIKLIEVIQRDHKDFNSRKDLLEISMNTKNDINSIPFMLTLKLCREFYIPLGASFSMVIPAWLRSLKRFPEEDIIKLETWYHSQGSPIRFSEYNIENITGDIDKYKSIIDFALKD